MHSGSSSLNLIHSEVCDHAPKVVPIRRSRQIVHPSTWLSDFDTTRATSYALFGLEKYIQYDHLSLVYMHFLVNYGKFREPTTYAEAVTDPI